MRTRERCTGIALELSATSLVCVAPPAPNAARAPGPARLQLALNGLDFLDLDTAPAFRFEYYPPPNASGFAPRGGDCGTLVTISGEAMGGLPHSSSASDSDSSSFASRPAGGDAAGSFSASGRLSDSLGEHQYGHFQRRPSAVGQRHPGQ